jgi:hypothetical protein
MATTIATALRAHLTSPEIPALGVRVHLDAAPRGERFPYLVMIPILGKAVALAGDARALARREPVQVELWQKVDDAGVGEDDALERTIRERLDGARITSDEQSIRVRLVNVIRFPRETPDNVIRTIFDLLVTHATS